MIKHGRCTDAARQECGERTERLEAQLEEARTALTEISLLDAESNNKALCLARGIARKALAGEE